MPGPTDHPFLMEMFPSPEQVRLGTNVTIVRGSGSEPRHSPKFPASARYLDILAQETDSFTYAYDGQESQVRLRSAANLAHLLQPIAGELYIDITALSHHIWAPILRAALQRSLVTRAIYIEPEQYVQSPTGLEGQIFDLSERITGVGAIPGFASFSDEFDDRSCFIPMLGFEGRRMAYVLEHVQPKGNKIIPIVGLPGFRLEYPFYTFHSNSRVLRETQAWKNVMYAAANNPFSLFDTLVEITKKYPTDLMKIAPIGTKPHALGAFLFPLKTSRRVEFVYDFPIRSQNRTTGVGKVFIYRISEFMKD